VKYKDKNMYSASIWDRRIGQKIAEVSNARINDIAYTSFEGAAGSLSYSYEQKGHWTMTRTILFAMLLLQQQ